MKDIVRILQDITEDKNIAYHYGKKATLNFLDGTLEAGKIFMLHEFTNRKSEYNDAGTKILAANYQGKFFLVSHECEESTITIEQISDVFNAIKDSIESTGIEVNQWESLNITDALDESMQGFLCSYKVRIGLTTELTN